MGGQIFQLRGTEAQTHNSGPESETQELPASVKDIQVSPEKLKASDRLNINSGVVYVLQSSF